MLRDLDAASRGGFNMTGGKPCSIAIARAALDPDDRALLDEWLAVPVGTPGRRSDRYLAGLLSKASGIDVALQQIGHHRRGSCRCARAHA